MDRLPIWRPSAIFAVVGEKTAGSWVVSGRVSGRRIRKWTNFFVVGGWFFVAKVASDLAKILAKKKQVSETDCRVPLEKKSSGKRQKERRQSSRAHTKGG
jgi:hypothetical protein